MSTRTTNPCVICISLFHACGLFFDHFVLSDQPGPPSYGSQGDPPNTDWPKWAPTLGLSPRQVASPCHCRVAMPFALHWGLNTCKLQQHKVMKVSSRSQCKTDAVSWLHFYRRNLKSKLWDRQSDDSAGYFYLISLYHSLDIAFSALASYSRLGSFGLFHAQKYQDFDPGLS